VRVIFKLVLIFILSPPGAFETIALIGVGRAPDLFPQSSLEPALGKFVPHLEPLSALSFYGTVADDVAHRKNRKLKTGCDILQRRGCDPIFCFFPEVGNFFDRIGLEQMTGRSILFALLTTRRTCIQFSI